jgi:hypothetical protein
LFDFTFKDDFIDVYIAAIYSSHEEEHFSGIIVSFLGNEELRRLWDEDDEKCK